MNGVYRAAEIEPADGYESPADVLPEERAAQGKQRRNSVALMVLLLRERLPLDGVVFADTGDELPETYEYLDIAREYLGARGFDLTVVAKRNGKSLYETSWGRKVFPSAIWR